MLVLLKNVLLRSSTTRDVRIAFPAPGMPEQNNAFFSVVNQV
jgi:hypothetical protein